MIALHTVVAIVVVVLLIIKVKVDPVISLMIGSLYLGLATGVGFTATITAIATGFGEIMGEVGLLIGFGVLIGAMLHAMGAFRKMVTMLVNGVGARRLPYALTAAMATIFPSIYVDVQVVLASPGGALDRALHRPDRFAAHVRRPRDRDLRRLRLRDSGTGSGLDRGPSGTSHSAPG